MIHRTALQLFAVLPRFLKDRTIRLLYPTFTAGTSVCISNADGQILLVTHTYSPGWGLPGGLIGRHESPTETASREIVEELGLQIDLTDAPIPFQSPGRRHWNMLFRTVLDPLPSEPIRSHSPEVAAVDWFYTDALPELAEFTSDMLALLGVIPASDNQAS